VKTFDWNATIELMDAEVVVDYEYIDGQVYIDDVSRDGYSVELTGEQWRDLYAALEEVVKDLDGATDPCE
jgi:hypothetical protein|tara:strand:- start:206 stop:415 length:210 start_codon:yes stop_codon:yes gene_type:complete